MIVGKGGWFEREVGWGVEDGGVWDGEVLGCLWSMALLGSGW